MSSSMKMPWGSVMALMPQEFRKLPSRSKIITGGSLRWKTYTRSWESVATARVLPQVSPAGNLAQFSMRV